MAKRGTRLIDVGYKDIVLRAFILFVQTAYTVLKYADAHFYRQTGLSVIKFIVLQALAINGGSMRPSEIAEWTYRERHNIAPEHNRGHAVITDAQLGYIGQHTRQHQKQMTVARWDDGTVKMTTKFAGGVINDHPCALNALGRKGIVSGFLKELPGYGGFAAKRWWLDAEALEDYLVLQQRHEDAQHLRLGIEQLYSSPYDQVVAEQTSGLLSSPPIVLRSNDARNEGETRLFQQP